QEEKIETSFKSSSFDIKFHDVQGKNYQFAIPKLNKSIVPEKCKILVKPTRVVITLIKDSRGNWSDLHFKEDKLKSGLDKDKDKDPMAGIMDLMKNMYEEGDEEMKKTIAKAWTDARSGKTADSLGGKKMAAVQTQKLMPSLCIVKTLTFVIEFCLCSFSKLSFPDAKNRKVNKPAEMPIM
ncbi:Calcyclin-binding protein-like protein, partial [Drosera capensis]